jgi:hypothetical protein
MRTSVVVLLVAAHIADAAPPTDTGSEDEPEAATPELALPTLLRPTHPRGQIAAMSSAGYDAASGTALFAAALEGAITDRIAIRVATGNHGASDDLRASGGLIVALVGDAHSTVNVSAAALYETRSWNTVPAVTAHVVTGIRHGATTVVVDTGLGIGLDEGEASGTARLVGLRALGDRYSVGVDIQGQIDLERDADEPPGEPDWNLHAGPVATAALGRVVLSVGAAAATLRFRGQETSRSGAVGTMGLGFAF